MSSEKFIDDLVEASACEEVRDFLEDAVGSLIDATTPVVFHPGSDRLSHNFIHPQSRLKPSMLAKGFRIDDAVIYEYFSSSLLSRKDTEDYDPDEIVILAAQDATTRYFGGIAQDNLGARRHLMGGPRGSVKSLETVAKSGLAMCMERASVAHNMCQLAGVRSIFVTGNAQMPPAAVQNHAFQAVNVSGRHMLFDVTNPSLDYRSSGSNPILRPTLFPIDVKDLLAGSVQQTTLQQTRDGYVEEAALIGYRTDLAHPITFEDFDALSFWQRIAVGLLHPNEHRALASIEVDEVLEKHFL